MNKEIKVEKIEKEGIYTFVYLIVDGERIKVPFIEDIKPNNLKK